MFTLVNLNEIKGSKFTLARYLFHDAEGGAVGASLDNEAGQRLFNPLQNILLMFADLFFNAG